MASETAEERPADKPDAPPGAVADGQTECITQTADPQAVDGRALATELQRSSNRERPSQTVAVAQERDTRPLAERLASRAVKLKDPAQWPRVPDCPSGPGLPNLNIVGRLSSLPRRYCTAVTRRPGLFLFFYVVAVIAAVAFSWRTLKVNTDVDAFRRVDAPAARSQDVFLEALKRTRAVKNQSSLGDRKAFELEIFYQAKGNSDRDESVFSEAVLRDIRDFEQRLRALPGWQRLCQRSDSRSQFRCEPGESLGNYMWPRRLDAFLGANGLFRLRFDGSARERMPVDATLTYLGEGLASPHDPWRFLPEDFQGPQSSSMMMRSLFTFTSPTLDAGEYSQEYADFVSQELYPMLSEEAKKTREEHDPNSWDLPLNINVFFRGDEVDQHEVKEAVWHDMNFAIVALLVAFVLTWVHIRSLFLTFVAFAILTLSVLSAFCAIRVEEVGLPSFLAIFLVFGLGGNSFFKLQDLWLRKRETRVAGAEVTHLMGFYRASFLQLVPILVTALIFLVLLLSKFRPLREFGLVMGACMVCRCLLSLLVFVPALLVHEQTVWPFLSRRCPQVLRGLLEPGRELLPWPAVAKRCVLVAHFGRGKLVLVVTVCFTLIALFATVGVTLTDEGDSLPEVFSRAHHRSEGRKIVGDFSPSRASDVPAPLGVTVCEPWRETAGGDEGCALHWCNAHLQSRNKTDDGCTCYKKATSATAQCTEVEVVAQLAGRSADFDANQWKSALGAYVQEEWSAAAEHVAPEGTLEDLPSLVLEHWETGATTLESLVQLPAAKVKYASAVQAASDCVEKLFCHCGAKSCLEPQGYEQISKRMALPQAERRLTTNLAATVGLTGSQGKKSIQVAIVYGITPPEDGMLLDGTPSWEFDKTFDPESPWSQRAMLRMCAETSEDLRILEKKCWISDFRAWLIARGDIFPVQRFGSFQADVKLFLAGNADASSTLWLNSDGNLRATSFTMKVQPDATASAAMRQREKWLRHVSDRNAEAATTASQAWATSSAWVDAEAFKEALSSTWLVTACTLLAIALAGLAFTMDFEMIGLIILVAFVACTFLFFIMFCILRWMLGPWELIMATVFFTYSVETVFRIARDFVKPCAGTPVKSAAAAAEAEEPSAAAAPEEPPPAPDPPPAALRRSVEQQAGAVLSASAKLFCCGIFMLPCQLRIFAQLGAVAIAVSLIQVPCTLVLLPAAVLLSGRTRREPDMKPLARFLWRYTSWLFS